MAILRLLSEEVFDFGTGLTSSRAVQLKQQFCGQFEAVHELCYEILVILFKKIIGIIKIRILLLECFKVF